MHKDDDSDSGPGSQSEDSEEYSNYVLSLISGKWYEKFHDLPHH